ncbi:MAG: hypothetical protein KKD76_01925, partial [Verrucomicrobia bacterium]|nr:hypothetical protein [Verrucomicrobiota bacterium]
GERTALENALFSSVSPSTKRGSRIVRLVKGASAVIKVLPYGRLICINAEVRSQLVLPPSRSPLWQAQEGLSEGFTSQSSKVRIKKLQLKNNNLSAGGFAPF